MNILKLLDFLYFLEFFSHLQDPLKISVSALALRVRRIM